jgi:twitching motility protein PilT
MTPRDRLFGELAIKSGFVSRAAVSQLLAAFPDTPLRELLLQRSRLTPEQAQALDLQCEQLLAGSRKPSADAPPATAPAEGPYLHKVLAYALRKSASDLHVHGEAPLLSRIAGQLTPLKGDAPISTADATKMVLQLLRPEQRQVLETVGQLDFAYDVEELGRFRVNVYRDFRGTSAVFRLIPRAIPTLAELGLPATLTSLTDFRTGIVLCTGPTGCGKSTTLAALVQHLNATRQDHVITLENPIEHVYPKSRCQVNQREVVTHTQSFARALRAALREDPDIIAITELRDHESMGLALSAAETGHLVLGTLHTSGAAQTISRIINAFPGPEQEHVRAQLSESLRAVVSQRLVPRADGAGLIPAIEILVVTTAVANIIRDDKIHQLPSVMQTGKALGMVSLDESLLQLVAAGTVNKADARAVAVQKERFN